MGVSRPLGRGGRLQVPQSAWSHTGPGRAFSANYCNLRRTSGRVAPLGRLERQPVARPECVSALRGVSGRSRYHFGRRSRIRRNARVAVSPRPRFPPVRPGESQDGIPLPAPHVSVPHRGPRERVRHGKRANGRWLPRPARRTPRGSVDESRAGAVASAGPGRVAGRELSPLGRLDDSQHRPPHRLGERGPGVDDGLQAGVRPCRIGSRCAARAGLRVASGGNCSFARGLRW